MSFIQQASLIDVRVDWVTCSYMPARHAMRVSPQKPSSSWHKAQAYGVLLGTQGLDLGLTALRLVSQEEDMRAGLALIASIRKRLCNLPGELVADEEWRVRFPDTTCGASIRLSWCKLGCVSSGTCACCS